MIPDSWQSRLNLAPGADEVLALCREFIAECTHHDLAQLAAACKPVPCRDVAEVHQYALALIRHAAIGDRFGAPAVHRLSTFFTRAALRLMELEPQAEEQRRRG